MPQQPQPQQPQPQQPQPTEAKAPTHKPIEMPPYPFSECDEGKSLLDSECAAEWPRSCHLLLQVIDDAAPGLREKIDKMKRDFIPGHGAVEPDIFKHMSRHKDAHSCKAARITFSPQEGAGTVGTPQHWSDMDWLQKPVVIPAHSYRECIIGNSDFRLYESNGKYYLQAVRGVHRQDNRNIPPAEIRLTQEDLPPRSQVKASLTDGTFPLWIVKCEEEEDGYDGKHRKWSELLRLVAKDQRPTLTLSVSLSANLINAANPEFANQYSPEAYN